MGWPDIVTAGLTGIATGALASIFAPWANWGAEKRRLRRQGRVERIGEWREGVAELRLAEDQASELGHVPGQPPTDKVPVDDERMKAEKLAELMNKSWFNTLKPMLSKTALQSIDWLRSQPTQRRRGAIPNVLEAEIGRIEQKWKLV